MLETSSTKTVLNKPSSLPPNNRRRSTKDFSTTRTTLCNDKSDTYYEEFSLQTVTQGNGNGNGNVANDKQCLTEGNCQPQQPQPQLKQPSGIRIGGAVIGNGTGSAATNNNATKIKNGHAVITLTTDDGAFSDKQPCIIKNVNEMAPNSHTGPVLDPQKSQNQNQKESLKFGKHLNIKNGQQKQNNEECGVVGVRFLPQPGPGKQVNILNNKSKLTWYNTNEQTDAPMSDSDSEDTTDNALSAFGISSSGKRAK